MEAQVSTPTQRFRKTLHSLTTMSSGEFDLQNASSTTTPAAVPAPTSPSSSSSSSPSSSSSSSTTSSPSPSRTQMKPFNAQSIRELQIQTQAHLRPQSEIFQQLELEMSQSPQAAILRRMKEEERLHHGHDAQPDAAKIEDERIRQLERASLSRELEYLLAEEVVPTITDVLQHLTICLEELKGDIEGLTRQNAVEETLEDQKKRLQKKVALNLDSMLKYGNSLKGKEKEETEVKESEEDKKKESKHSHVISFNKRAEEGMTSLRGYAALTGWRVYKSDLHIEVKPTWGKKMPFSVKLQASHLTPLRIPQIQNAHNYIKLAFDSLKRLQKRAESNGGPEARSLTNTLQKVKEDLRMAREQLVTFESSEFPESLFAPTGFLHPPPPDVSLGFHVHNAQLILSVYILQISPLPAKLGKEPQQAHPKSGASSAKATKNQATSKPTRRAPKVGQAYDWQGKKIVVMDVVNIANDLASLKTSVQALEEADDLVDALRDKLLAVYR